MNIYCRISFELARLFITKKNKHWILRAASVLFPIQQKEAIEDAILCPTGGSQIYLQKLQVDNNNGKPWLSFHASAGYPFRVGKNAVTVGLKANYCPATFVKGDYHFNVGSQPEQQGQCGVTGSYLGLTVEYIFSGKVRNNDD